MFKLINGWTKEKVMEQVKKYNDGTRSVIRNSCVYNSPNGNRCAVGCFIPDNHLGLNHSGFAHYLITAYPDLKDRMPFRGDALTEFQSIHDNCKGNVHEAIQAFLDDEVE